MDEKTQTEKYTDNVMLSRGLVASLPAATAIIYFVSNPRPQSYYDYTFRVAGRFLEGAVGLAEKPPDWLNEFVPFEGVYYSVFPLGAVLTMVPVAVLRALGIVAAMPGTLIAALSAAAIGYLLLTIAGRYDVGTPRQVLLTLAILFGTFMWTNLTFAGAWQLALGFAMIGELGAIYFTVFDRRPLVAGLFFALAFGNRTENLLTAPVFLYLLNRQESLASKKLPSRVNKNNMRQRDEDRRPGFDLKAADIALFCAFPFVLGIATLGYNYLRFHSIADFGYARIPGVLQEPWYNHGIFSVQYMPRQAWEMLLRLWEPRTTFPYLIPDPFSSSILLSSPFLLLSLRVGARDGGIKLASWTAVAILTLLLWIHGNSGGWQFGYRYAMILLPWTFLIILESAPRRITLVEWAAYGVSFVANAYATWLFHWTGYLKQ
jgi:hypothetical protein